ncbi:MAG TPA: HD domain-containing phosphohydrolase, partial [Motiliproteus sp.]
MNKTAKTGFRLLKDEDVEVGQPLRWAVHDEQGHLLLAKGAIVRNDNQRNRLLNQRVLIALSEEELAEQRRRKREEETDKNYVYRQKGADVFAWIDLHYDLLETSYRQLAEGPSPEALNQIRRLAVALQKAADKHSEGLLAAIYLGAEGKSYAVLKALHVAVLCHELARVNNLNPGMRLSLIAAGLTHDVAMWQMQDEIQLREAPLSDTQWQTIRNHTAAGVELLRKSGVTDPVWLSAVEQHHERLNGSGYHGGLTDAQIPQQARILAIADVFAAMVRTRGDRGKRVPKDAMREIFMSRGEEIDSTLVQLFIK